MRFDVPKGLGFVSKSAQRIGKQDSDVDDSSDYNVILNLYGSNSSEVLLFYG